MTRMLLISALFWIVSLLIYRLILKKYTFHELNRLYLLTTLIAGVLLPFLPMTQSHDGPLVAFMSPVTVGLSGVTSEVIAPVIEQGVNYGFWLWIIYGVMVVFLFFRFIKEIRQIRRKAKRGETVWHEGVRVVYSAGIQQPFSFWKWIFMGNIEPIDPIVFAHEYAHIKGRHTVDKILVQLLEAIYWIVPIFGFYRRYINEVQEYIADDYVLQATSRKKYSYFLLGQTNIAITPVLSNNFHSLIKNRITMILKEKSRKYKKLWYLPALLLIVAFASIILVSCNTEDENLPESPEVAQDQLNSEVIDAPSTVEMIDTIVTFDPNTSKETLDIVKSELEVFKVVDEMPLFTTAGCDGSLAEKKACSDKKMLEFIYKNIQYPEQAREKGLEGMVVMKFIVNKDGNLIHPGIIKSLGDVMDKEVLRVFSKMQEHRWIPGKQRGKKVAVEFFLPIKFKLG